MTYQLYGVRRSGSAAVEVLLTRLGVDFELHDATPWSCPPGPVFVGSMRRIDRLPGVAPIWAQRWGDSPADRRNLGSVRDPNAGQR